MKNVKCKAYVNWATVWRRAPDIAWHRCHFCQQRLTLLVLSFAGLSLTRISKPRMCLSFFFFLKQAMITVFQLGSGWRLTGGETQTGNLADALSAKFSDTCPNSDGTETKKKEKKKKRKEARPNLFHSVASLSFLWLAPACLSTAELLAASNQCVHCSLLPPSLSSHLSVSLSLSARQVRY